VTILDAIAQTAAADPARVLLADLATTGLTVTVDGDRLLVAPRSALTPELAARIKLLKPDLLAELEWRQETTLDRALKHGFDPFAIPGEPGLTLLTWFDTDGKHEWTIVWPTALLPEKAKKSS
jgi:hypothetical protein